MDEPTFDAGPLIAEAITRALALPEIAEVLERLRALAIDEPREAAEAVARREPATIEAAATEELRRLREVTGEYDRALEDAIASRRRHTRACASSSLGRAVNVRSDRGVTLASPAKAAARGRARETPGVRRSRELRGLRSAAPARRRP